MLKIHATRVPAPTAEQPHGTKWQVAVMDHDGTLERFDRVDIHGSCCVKALPEGERPDEQPRVWAEPMPQTDLVGFRNDNAARRYAWTGERYDYAAR